MDDLRVGCWDDLVARIRARNDPTLSQPSLQPAAVLVPLFARGERIHVVLTRRPETLSSHAGQVAFPGGKLGEGEESSRGALREAEEELGIPPAEVELIGRLGDVAVTTGYRMTPWVGRIPEALPMVPNPAEVARVFDVPLEDLVDPSRTRFSFKPFRAGGVIYQVPHFEWEDELIWGATGRVLCDLLEMLGWESD